MNLRVLQYLTAVADTQHFGKAAEKMLRQPAHAEHANQKI